MTTMEQKDISLPLKREREEFDFLDADDDNTSLEEINNLLSISLPCLSTNNFQFPTDLNDEFLRLTTKVRAVYFSYLHKCLLTNYILYYKEKDKDIQCEQLRNCANQMELHAVRSSLEATLYRQNMLKMISDVKSYTLDKKAYKKLVIFLESPPSKVDVGVQTINSWAELEKIDNIQSICITSNCEELFSEEHEPVLKEEEEGEDEEEIRGEEDEEEEEKDEKNVIDISEVQNDIVNPCNYNDTASPIVNSTCCTDIEDQSTFKLESDDDANTEVAVDSEIMKEEFNIFSCTQDDSNTQILNNPSSIKNEDENSQDSLLQHMEDMFCDSDDSSDLMTLIEKHSGVSKANVDKEINQMCLGSDSLFPLNSNGSTRIPENNDSTKINVKSNNTKSSNISTGKYSFSYYKEMKSREANKLLGVENDTPESKQKRRINSIWFVERVYQVSKLKAKMTELSLTNYRKHGRLKEKFIELFGESDDEEMMPDSPICIEEHLTACKERIAPWIVKHLMPFYKKRRIKNRQLFKVVAKHIADMLIIENTFPEQDCVSKYIETYFKNKKFIRTKQDVYL